MSADLVTKWHSLGNLSHRFWKCWHCEKSGGSTKGYHHEVVKWIDIAICQHCGFPTIFHSDAPHPAAPPGDDVPGVPDEIKEAYNETRRALASNSPRAAALLARTLLQYIAVEHGASSGEKFEHYVDYLGTKGFVPPGAKTWLDHVRRVGNDAAHVKQDVTHAQVVKLVEFMGLLLRFTYQFPNTAPPTNATPPPAPAPPASP